jgi:hypothetical protein
LYLTRPRADLYVKTLLERSKGSALDIIAVRNPLHRPGDLAIFSPHARRIGNLDFIYGYWTDIQKFSEVVSGPLPLLRTLKIHVSYDRDEHGELRGVVTPPSLPLFTGAVNLKEFRLRSEGSPFLDHFFFPNLTTLELSVTPGEGLPGSQLLNFLEASPALRAVHIQIWADVFLRDVPPGRVVTLPNVEKFDLFMGEDGPGCKIAAHISCPSARRTSLLYEQGADNPTSPEIFPTSVAWDAIARQYAASVVDEVVLEITTAQNPIITCLLTFLSPGPVVLVLGSKVTARYDDDDDDEEFEMPLGERHAEIFSRASMTIRTHPLLANVKRLRIRDRFTTIDSDELPRIAGEVRQLLKSVGPLDALIIDVFDLRPYLGPFLQFPEFRDMAQPDAFPPIKELEIAQLVQVPTQCAAAIVELAKLQHAAGMPFERVTLHVKNPPPEVTEWLSPWVGTVHCYD